MLTTEKVLIPRKAFIKCLGAIPQVLIPRKEKLREGMKYLTSKKAISPLDIGGGGIACQAQHSVVVLVAVDDGT